MRRKGATFFNKRARGLLQAARMFMLAVEDPNDPDNDLARGSYNISRVRQAFDFAYTQVCLFCVLARGHTTRLRFRCTYCLPDTHLRSAAHQPSPLRLRSCMRTCWRWVNCSATFRSVMPGQICSCTRVHAPASSDVGQSCLHPLRAQLTGAVEPGESLLQRLVRLDAILVERPRPPPHADDGDDAEHVVSPNPLLLGALHWLSCRLT